MIPLMDLHMHTTYSDGLLDPIDLINFAKAHNVDIMCINDHDTVKGVIKILTLDYSGITVLCGIELSSVWVNISGIHIAGYFPRDTDFVCMQNELTAAVSQQRIDRCKKMVQMMVDDGMNITWEEVIACCDNCLPSRPKIAQKNGVVSSHNEAFSKYIDINMKYYIPGNFMSPAEVISFVHRYRGVASLAHPWQLLVACVIDRLLSDPECVIDYCVQNSIDGMECFPPNSHVEYGTKRYIDIATKNGLISTSGSDYHGCKSPEILPGDNDYPEEAREKTLLFFKKHNII